jgi:general secretion pathway protein G
MAVIVVMAILGSIILGIAGYAGRKAAESRAIADLQKIRIVLEEYRITYGGYPQEDIVLLDGWFELFDTNTNLFRNLTFDDPWGRPYQYVPQSRFSYDLYSFGPSGGPHDAIDGDWQYDVIR